METEDPTVACKRWAMDMAAAAVDCYLAFATVLAVAMAECDAQEQRSGRVVLCDAALRVHSSVFSLWRD